MIEFFILSSTVCFNFLGAPELHKYPYSVIITRPREESCFNILKFSTRPYSSSGEKVEVKKICDFVGHRWEDAEFHGIKCPCAVQVCLRCGRRRSDAGSPGIWGPLYGPVMNSDGTWAR